MTKQTMERQRAFTALLANPVLQRHAHPEVWPLVRRHHPQLVDWFDSRLGYRLVVTDAAARLFRLPLNGRVFAPVRARPPSRRVLVLALLAAAAAEDAEDMTSTQELSDRVRVLLDRAAAELLPYQPDRFAERKLFVKAIELLTAVGALRPAVRADVEEQLSGWAHSTNVVGGAYHVERELLFRLVDPSCLTAALGGRPVAAAVHEANPRHAIMRRLIELPACLLSDLNGAERAYLTSQRHRIVHWCTEMTGWTVEQRAEGLALIPGDESGTDLPFPRVRAGDFGALLILDELIRSGPGVIDRDTIDAAAAQVCAGYPKALTQDYRESPLRLADDAIDLLCALDLLRPAGAGWTVTPSAARFRNPAVVQLGPSRLDEEPSP